MPALRESLLLGSLALLGLFFFEPRWAWGFLYGFLVVFGTRLIFTKIISLKPGFLGFLALAKQLALVGLSVGGILLGLNPIGVALGLFIWPISVWIWAVRHVRHSR
ncbi:hypothetical protein H5T56_03585 [Candidatus Bipolaricaulota bacterium]|nr:hypothetical protein [Candidatus Bipolaricaulota bacterium]